MKDFHKYRHIIWDWNGTLFDDVSLCIEANNKLLKNRDLKLIDYDIYTKNFCFPIKTFYKVIGFDLEKEKFEDVINEFIEEYESHYHECKLYNGAIDIFEYFKNLGITQSILSVANSKSLKSIIKRLGIEDYFIGINALENNHAESKVEIGKHWMKKQGFDPEDVLIIGDTVHDLEVAKEIGCDCLLIANGCYSYERLNETGAEVISNIEELLEKIMENIK